MSFVNITRLINILNTKLESCTDVKKDEEAKQLSLLSLKGFILLEQTVQ
jgi:hypothetical protein